MMKPIKRVMLPTDFSSATQAAISYASAMVEAFDAELHVMHVLEVHASTTPVFGGGLTLAQFVKESRDAAVRHLDKTIDPQWASRYSVVRAVREGNPYAEIVDYARENAIDLIVMTTFGRSGLAHMLIGSVAERVVRKAPCPVLVVHPELETSSSA
ncbi:MAG: universal stress protein [Pirellulaceae bacterium]